jgi:membrane protease YdiL (CAAX protease family)
MAPWLYWAGHHASGIHGLRFLAETDFQRFFNRSMLISAFLLFIPTLRWIGAHRLKSLGLKKNSHRFQDLFGGFLIAACVMIGLGFVLVALGVFQFKDPLPLKLLPKILLTAVVVGTLEETLFRGAILGLVRQSYSPHSSALFVSALFSVVHFLKPPDDKIQDVSWYSGFALLPHVFHQFSEPLLLLGLFITLTILGLILAHATIRTQSLWLPIGIHAGLIFGKMGFSKVAKRLQDVMPWFSSDISVGIGSLMILLFLWLLIWLIFLRASVPSRI